MKFASWYLGFLKLGLTYVLRKSALGVCGGGGFTLNHVSGKRKWGGAGGTVRGEVEKSIFPWRGLQRPCMLLPAVLVEIKRSHPFQHTVLQPYAPRLVAQPFLRGQSLVTLVAPPVLPSHSHPSQEATWPSIPAFSRGAEPLPSAVRPPHIHFQFSMMRR